MDNLEKEVLKTEEVSEEKTDEITEEISTEQLQQPTEEIYTEQESQIEEFDPQEHYASEEIFETQKNKKNKKASKIIAIVLCIFITLIGIGGSAAGWFYAKPKYDAKVETVSNDMANYGYFYALYSVFAEEETYSSAYATQAQMTYSAYESDLKAAQTMQTYMYIIFAAAGVFTASGVAGLVIILSRKTKKEELSIEQTAEVYENQFDFYEDTAEVTAEQESTETEEKQEAVEETAETDETSKALEQEQTEE